MAQRVLAMFGHDGARTMAMIELETLEAPDEESLATQRGQAGGNKGFHLVMARGGTSVEQLPRAVMLTPQGRLRLSSAPVRFRSSHAARRPIETLFT